jgi:hypothetical protein
MDTHSNTSLSLSEAYWEASSFSRSGYKQISRFELPTRAVLAKAEDIVLLHHRGDTRTTKAEKSTRLSGKLDRRKNHSIALLKKGQSLEQIEFVKRWSTAA